MEGLGRSWNTAARNGTEGAEQASGCWDKTAVTEHSTRKLSTEGSGRPGTSAAPLSGDKSERKPGPK